MRTRGSSVKRMRCLVVGCRWSTGRDEETPERLRLHNLTHSVEQVQQARADKLAIRHRTVRA